MYAWWNNSDRTRFWRIQSADIDVRRYFGREALTGWYAGVSAQILRYDICLGSTGYLSSHSGAAIFDRPSYAIVAEGGYSLRLNRHLNLDLNFGVGYLGGPYQTYRPSPVHNQWLSTRQRKYFGPLKAGVSLVWRLGKGGSR